MKAQKILIYILLCYVSHLDSFASFDLIQEACMIISFKEFVIDLTFRSYMNVAFQESTNRKHITPLSIVRCVWISIRLGASIF